MKNPITFTDLRLNLMRAFSCLLTSTFVLTQCAFAVANDAPALALSSSGAPVLNVNSESIDQAQAERQVRTEEEKKNKEDVEKSKLFPGEDNPLSLSDLEAAVMENKKTDIKSAQKEEQPKEARSLFQSSNEKSVSAEANKTSSGIITPPFFASFRDLLVKEEASDRQDKLVEQKKNEEKKEREDERSIIEEAKKIVDKITSDYYRGRVSEETSDYLPISKDRKILKSMVEDVVSSKDGKPNASAINSFVFTATGSLSASTSIPGSELTAPISDSSVHLANASAESNMDRSNLLLINPQSYVMPLSQIASSMVRILSALVSMTNNPGLMGGTEGLFAHSIELLKQDIAQAILRMTDLQNAVEQLSEEQRTMSHEFGAEVALVNKFAKALAGRSDATKTELEKIISNAKPVYIDQDYLLQAQSMLIYIETQLTKLEEIQTRRAQFVESLTKASADPAALRSQLKETSKMLIDVEVLKSLVNATKTQLLEVFRDLQKSQVRLRQAIEKIREFRSKAVGDLTQEAGSAKDHIYFVYASSMQVREQTTELNALREKIRAEAKNNYAAIVEYYQSLRQIDTSNLASPTKEEIETLRSHAEKLIPEKEHGVIEGSSQFTDESVWQGILLRASNIELSINADLSNASAADQANVPELFRQLEQVVGEAEHLAASELKYADNTEVETRNTEALAKGLAKRLELLIGYSQEIQNILAKAGVDVNLVN